MKLNNNCPESKDYYEKGCRQRKTGRILSIWVPIGCIVGGAVIGEIAWDGFNGYLGGAGYGALVGASTALASIPFFISGKYY